jgi:hypothetical protein
MTTSRARIRRGEGEGEASSQVGSSKVESKESSVIIRTSMPRSAMAQLGDSMKERMKEWLGQRRKEGGGRGDAYPVSVPSGTPVM